MNKRRSILKFAPANAIELEALGEKPDGFIAGWASTSDIDSYGHIVAGGAFAKAIEKRGITGPKSIKLLIGHDWDKPAGAITRLEYMGDRLWIEAQLNLAISYAKDMYEASKMAGGMNFSVGFTIDDFDKDIEIIEAKGSTPEHMLIKSGDLFEISVVPFPANEEATMDVIKSKDDDWVPETIAEFEKALVEKGLVKGRNDAKIVTLAVMKAPDLFKKETKAPVADVDENQPRLAEQVKSLSEKMRKFTALMERSG